MAVDEARDSYLTEHGCVVWRCYAESSGRAKCILDTLILLNDGLASPCASAHGGRFTSARLASRRAARYLARCSKMGQFLAPNPLKRWRRLQRCAAALRAPFLALVSAARPRRPMALWRIVHGECVPHVEAGQGPKPCEAVDLSEARRRASRSSRTSSASRRCSPSRPVASPASKTRRCSTPDAPNVSPIGWKAQGAGRARASGEPLPREAVAIAINSKWARSQDQLHSTSIAWRSRVAAALADYRRRSTSTGAR